MSITNRTPVKTVIQDDITTPQQPHLDDTTEDDLMGCFSEMKVSQGGFYKRFAESDTIEGSPVNALRFKKQDLRPTPYKFDNNQFNDDDDIPKLASVIQRNPISTKNESINSNSPKLLVICSASEEHNTGDHQENALRTALLCGPEGCLRRPELNEHIQWINSDHLKPAPMVDLLRVHEYTYLQYIDQKCKASTAAINSTTSTTTVTGTTGNKEGQLRLPGFYAPPGMLDSDTPLQVQSLEAAKRFCGAAILAVDHIMQGRNTTTTTTTTTAVEKVEKASSSCDRAFVIGRPPGHHAGPNGCVPSQYYWLRPDMASSGFCLLNTVAVAAAYARHQYGRWAWRNMTMQTNPVIPTPSTVSGIPTATREEEWRAPRIAIVDIDIHHGNGTEEIVRNLTPHMTHLPLPSSWAPMQTLSYKPWLSDADADEVFFSSVHLYAGERFYPCSGPDTFPAEAPPSPTHPISTSSTIPIQQQQQATTTSPSAEHIVNIALTPIGPGPWDRKARAKLTPAQRDVLCKQASQEFRTKITTMLIPRITTFNADLIFISAGFDAHYDDMYHFLTEDDIHWVTEELCGVARLSGGSRGCGVISILEGGYSLSSPLPKTKPTRTTAATTSTAATATNSANSTVNSAIPSNTLNTTSLEHSTATTTTTAPGTTIPVPPVGTAQLGRGGRQKAKKEKVLPTNTTSTSATTATLSHTNTNTLAVSTLSPTDKNNNPTTNPSSTSNLSFTIPAAVIKKESEKFEVPPLAPTTAVHVPYISPLCMTAGSTETGVSTGTGLSIVNKSITVQGEDMHSKFAQRPGDGGLVKGVLAHTAALVGAKNWTSR